MNNLKSKAGFTLVELIVVIAILAILAGVGTAAYTGYIKKANDAAVLSELSAVITAAQAANATTTTPVTQVEVLASGAIEVNNVAMADGSDFDTFYGSHTFKGDLDETTYSTGAYWTSTSGKWNAGTAPSGT